MTPTAPGLGGSTVFPLKASKLERTSFCLGIILIAVSRSYAVAGDIEPSDADLHAAYCTQILKNELALGQHLTHSLENSPTSSGSHAQALNDARNLALQSAKNLVQTDSALLNRVQLYLLPRIYNMEMVGNLTAMAAARTDFARLQSMVNSCLTKVCMINHKSPSCDLKQCYIGKMPDYVAVSHKVKSCQSLQWLPY